MNACGGGRCSAIRRKSRFPAKSAKSSISCHDGGIGGQSDPGGPHIRPKPAMFPPLLRKGLHCALFLSCGASQKTSRCQQGAPHAVVRLNCTVAERTCNKVTEPLARVSIATDPKCAGSVDNMRADDSMASDALQEGLISVADETSLQQRQPRSLSQ